MAAWNEVGVEKKWASSPSRPLTSPSSSSSVVAGVPATCSARASIRTNSTASRWDASEAASSPESEVTAGRVRG